MAEQKKINVPEPHGLLPEALKKKWKAAYSGAYQEVSGDNSIDESHRVQAALKEANRVLRVPQPEGYDDAMALEDWQLMSRIEAAGEVRGVTIDGKKFRFKAPAKSDPPAGKSKPKGDN